MAVKSNNKTFKGHNNKIGGVSLTPHEYLPLSNTMFLSLPCHAFAVLFLHIPSVHPTLTPFWSSTSSEIGFLMLSGLDLESFTLYCRRFMTVKKWGEGGGRTVWGRIEMEVRSEVGMGVEG